MKKLLSLFFGLFSLFAARDSLASDVTLFAGFQNPGKLTLGNLVQDTSNAGVVGARFSTGRLLGFEQSLGFSSKFLESGRRALNAQSNLIVGVPVVRISPYVTAGVGFITTYGDSIRNFGDIGTKFTVNYGGGVKFKNLAGPLGFRVDVRGYSVPKVFNQTLNFVEASVGILLSW